MKRPLAAALIFLVGGVLAGCYGLPLLPSAAAAAGAALGLWARFRGRAAVVFFAFYLAGLAAVAFRTGTDGEALALARSGERAVIRGTVADEARTASGYRLIIETENGVKIAAQTMNEAPVGVGGAAEFEAVIEELGRRREPWEFDEYLYLRARGVQFKAFAREIRPGRPLGALPVLRNRLAEAYGKLLPARESGLVNAMITGDKTGLSDEIKGLYRVAGVYHLLAISGLHISVLAVFVNYVLARVAGRRFGGAATMAFLAAYCAFTGFSPSAVRAGVMCSVILFGDIILREKDALSSASFAAILLLMWQPLYLFDAGFQYSFAAVFGIVTLAKPIGSALGGVSLGGVPLRMPKLLADTFSVTLAATAATAPIAAWHFYYFMPYGLLSNLIITPTAGVIVVLGFLTGLAGLVFMPLAEVLAAGVYIIFGFYEAVCGVFASLPGAEILTGRWHWALMLAWYLPLIAAALYLAGRPPRAAETGGNKRRVAPAGLFQLWLAGFAALAFACSLPGGPKLYRIADSDCRIAVSGGEAYVFDGGGAEAQAVANCLDFHAAKDVSYFGLHENINAADAVISGIGNARAVFARPGLGGLSYYGESGVYFSEIAPGDILQKGGAEIRITDGFGAELRLGGRELSIEGTGGGG